jgi:hypothetical protein
MRTSRLWRLAVACRLDAFITGPNSLGSTSIPVASAANTTPL